LEKTNGAFKKENKILKFLLFCAMHTYLFIRNRHILYVIMISIRAFVTPHRKLYRFPMMGVKKYCLKNQLKISVVEPETDRLVCTPKYFGSFEQEEIHILKSPEIYLADLYDVDIIGANSIIMKDQYCLYDMFELDTLKRYDFEFASIKTMDRDDKAIIVAMDTGIIIEEGIFLLGFGSSNYFHLTVELIAKLKYIDNEPEIRSLPILVDESIMKVPQFRQMIEVVNIHERQIIPLKSGHKYRVKRLVFPSDCSWMPINIKNNTSLDIQDFRVAEGNLRYVRETVMKNLKIEKCVPTRKIFISRKSQYSGRLINEAEVSQLFGQYGYEVIYPEDLTFEQQVRVFSEAKYIAGVTGAGLTNILYCSPGTTFICIIPQKHNFYMYSTIAKMMALNPVFLDAQVLRQGDKGSSDKFILPIDYCSAFLDTLDSTKTGVA